MTRYIILSMFILFAIACKKRNDEFSFAGAWEIQRVEVIKYKSGNKIWDTAITKEPGWFALQNATGWDGSGKVHINYPTITGLVTKYDSEWSIDEYSGDRIEINGVTLTRERGGAEEKWSYMKTDSAGLNYTRETMYVKHQ